MNKLTLLKQHLKKIVPFQNGGQNIMLIYANKRENDGVDFFYFTLFLFILFYFILFYFILFYFTLFYFIFVFYFILLYFILFYFILFYFILFYLRRKKRIR